MENTAYRNAMELLARRRSQAEKDAAMRREELYRSLPQLREYDGKAAALCRQMTTAVINGEPIEAYQKGLEQVQRDKLHTLAAAGIEEELLRPQYLSIIAITFSISSASTQSISILSSPKLAI